MYTFKENAEEAAIKAYLEKYPITPDYINYKLTFSSNLNQYNMVDYCKDSLSILNPESKELKEVINYLNSELKITFEHYNGKVKIEDKGRFLLNTIKLLVDDKESTLSKAGKFIKKSDETLFNDGTTIENAITYSLNGMFLLNIQDKLYLRLHEYLKYRIKKLIQEVESARSIESLKLDMSGVNLEWKDVEYSRVSIIIHNLSIYFMCMDAASHIRFYDADIIPVLMNYLCEDTKAHARVNAGEAIGNLLVTNHIYQENIFKPEILEQLFVLLRNQTNELKQKLSSSKLVEHVLYLVSVISSDFYKYSKQNQNLILDILFAIFQAKHDHINKIKQIYVMNAYGIIIEATNDENKEILIPFCQNIIKTLVIWSVYSQYDDFKVKAADLILKTLKQKLDSNIILNSGLIELIIINTNNINKPSVNTHYAKAKDIIIRLYGDFFSRLFAIEPTGKALINKYNSEKIVKDDAQRHINKKMKKS